MMNKKEFDLEKMVAKAAGMVSELSLTRRNGFMGVYLEDIDPTPALVREKLLTLVWTLSVEWLNRHCAGKELLAAEGAVSSLMKKGALQEDVVFKKDSFRVKLENLEYRLFKNVKPGTLHVCPWPGCGKACEVVMSGARLGEFILEYDAKVPEMLSLVPELFGKLRSKKLELEKEEASERLIQRTLEALAKQYLKPLGVSLEYYSCGKGKVTVSLRQVREGRLELPLGDLMDRLKDPKGVLDLLENDKAPVCRRRNYPF